MQKLTFKTVFELSFFIKKINHRQVTEILVSNDYKSVTFVDTANHLVSEVRVNVAITRAHILRQLLKHYIYE